MPKYLIIAEFIDIEKGQRKYPGDIIEADGDRAGRLKKAGAIGKEIIDGETEPTEQAPAGKSAEQSGESEPRQKKEVESQEEGESMRKPPPVKRRKARG